MHASIHVCKSIIAIIYAVTTIFIVSSASAGSKSPMQGPKEGRGRAGERKERRKLRGRKEGRKEGKEA
jgi:hypothetical protein